MSKQHNGVHGATRITRSSTSFRVKPKNIATIDFGTTHCSVTYQLNAHLAADDTKPEILKLDESGPLAARVPSCILFDRQGKRRFFGYQAREQYYQMKHEERPDFIYFEQIKMKLQHDKNVDRNMKAVAMNGKQYFLIDVIAHILCHLKEQLLRVVRDFGLIFDSTDFDWVITVPAIWKAKGKRMMREAGYKAGLCSEKSPPNLNEARGFSPHPENEKSPEKLSLALEPESAAVYCQHEAKNARKGADKKFLPKSDHYLVLDIGGGTVDIATHSVAAGGIIELAPSAGNDWGGTRINKEFEKFLAEFIADPGYSHYLNKANNEKYVRHMAELTNLIYSQFEAQKLLFGSGAEADTYKIEFPRSFWKMYDDAIESGSKKGYSGITIEDDGGVMRISPDRMAKFFRPAVDGINNLLETHIKTNNLSKVIDTVYMVGGFGGCAYLRQEIEKKLRKFVPNWTACVPCHPNLAVIYGATAFRCNPGIVTKRKADATYGMGCAIVYDASIHRRDYKYWNEDKENYYCSNLFMAFIERGDLIAYDDVYCTTYTTSKKDQQSMSFTLYSAPRRDVWYTTEDEVYVLGKLKIDMGGYGLDRDVEIILDVTHSELQLLARDKTSGNEVKLIADFLSSERD